MMHTIEKIIGALRGVSLSDRERKNMRLFLESHIRENPPQMAYSTRLGSSLSSIGKSFANALNSETFLTHPIFAACVLVLCIGIGTSYAAQSALPGQVLYSFKTRVNEPLQGALALTPQAKAQWSAELTNRRLQEAEELAATNGLSPVATADIETGLDWAVQNFNSNVALISKEDDVQAANAQSDLEATLNAHEIVLESLPTSQKDNTSHISTLVRKHVDVLSKERFSSEAALTATDSPIVRAAALTQQKTAQDTIHKIKLLSQTASDTQIASSAAAIAQEASSDIQVGDSEAKNGNWGHAYGAFQDAVRKMKETEDSAGMRTWLKTQFGIGFDDTASSTTATSTDEVQVNPED